MHVEKVQKECFFLPQKNYCTVMERKICLVLRHYFGIFDAISFSDRNLCNFGYAM